MIVGCKDQDRWFILHKLFDTDNFKITLTEDANTVELCGGLKVSSFCVCCHKDDFSLLEFETIF